jgi:hypothetical protein
MSRSALKGLQAAAGAAGGDPVYVDDVFSTYLYTGTGSSLAINNGIDLSGEGGLVWLKRRSSNKGHHLYDTARGVTKMLSSDGNDAEDTKSQGLTAFNSDGFTLGTESQINGSTSTNVGWSFRKQPGFFDVVTYTGNGGSNRAISHNLNSKPGLIIIKATSMSAGWMVGAGFTSTQYYRLALETSAAADQAALRDYNNYLSAEPTTTTFSVGNEGLGNANGQTYVAYLFANDDQRFGENSDEAIIKCGTFTGNPTTIDLGFEPQWMIAKKYDSTSPWQMFDTMRGWTADGGTKDLEADTSSAETDRTSQNYTQLKSTGVTFNSYGGSWIYMAIRRPHKPAEELAATSLFKASTYTGSGAGTSVTTGFPVDMTLVKCRNTGSTQTEVWNRLRGKKGYLFTDSTASQGNFGSDQWIIDNMTGYTWAATDGYTNDSSRTYVAWDFKRAPGFFDVVTYTGTGSATTIAHNLGVAPEMIWLKNRSATANWELYLNAGGTEYGYYGLDQKYVGLNTSLSTWNNTSPTNSVVSVSSQFSNSSYSYVMYLFASVSGISKVGTYSGTGSELTVDCGFSAGARFVLIKRADNSMGSGGESYFVFDTARGITASSSPYLPLNDTDAEASGSFVKPDSSGFKVTTESVVNTSGSTYAFYAIA